MSSTFSIIASTTKCVKCVGCNKRFNTGSTLMKYSNTKQRPPNAESMEYQCLKCRRAFAAEKALQQHTKSVHNKKTLPCGQCQKRFRIESALHAHCEAKKHVLPGSHRCRDCSHPFTTEEALNKHHDETYHRSHSDVNTPSSVDDGNITPASQHGNPEVAVNSLHQAMKVLVISNAEDSGDEEARLIKSRESALDLFFESFENFDYNPALCAATSFAQLRKQHGVAGYGSADRLRSQFHKAIDMELEQHYGDRNNLVAYQTLCTEVAGIQASKSMKACKKDLSKIHVNIFHLVAFARETARWIGTDNAGSKPKLQTFDSVTKLRKYCMSRKKKFPLAGGAQFNGDRSAALNAFLRFFRY